ncbi:hypothetical protein CRU98_04950 [Arcobacter sp. CECT 8986]|uniref:AEC family transporter n=1 Tax=Arcobacter sp. CECT 8986 TaxID=2044507 RepID=UPI0010099879|nr:AEC family transporter [Arcobacter sp. CECT 8986]RXK00509.1 hypothetical protein CRU98_04950 [Arcobacter sp. CECT 8986]
MENFSLIIVAIIIGYTLQKFKIFSQETPIILNQYTIYISLPAIILLQVPKLSISIDIIIPAIIAWVVIIVTAIIVLVFAKYLKWSKEITGSLLLVAVLSNSSIAGIPLISMYIGEKAIPYVVIYDQLGTFIALTTYGTLITALYTDSKKTTPRIIVRKVLTFPPFLSLIIAFCFLGVDFPPLLTSILKDFSATLIPVALVAVGLQLKLKLPKSDLQPLSIALLIKLIIGPVVAYLFATSLGWHHTLASDVSILEAGMSPMITAGAIAAMVGLAPRLSTAIVGYGIVVSFLTTYVISRIL